MSFKLPKLPTSTSKSIRFPDDLIEEVELLIRGTGNTFSSFVIAAVRFAVDDMKRQAAQPQEKTDQ